MLLNFVGVLMRAGPASDRLRTESGMDVASSRSRADVSVVLVDIQNVL